MISPMAMRSPQLFGFIYDYKNGLVSSFGINKSDRKSYPTVHMHCICPKKIPENLIDDQTTFSQIKVQCHEATSSCLTECPHRSVTPGSTKPLPDPDIWHCTMSLSHNELTVDKIVLTQIKNDKVLSGHKELTVEKNHPDRFMTPYGITRPQSVHCR